jgi:hypothetical protein
MPDSSPLVFNVVMCAFSDVCPVCARSGSSRVPCDCPLVGACEVCRSQWLLWETSLCFPGLLRGH